MVMCAWGSALIAFAFLLVVSFLFKFTESLSRVGIAIWFTLSVVYLYSWRLGVYLYKRNRRKLGLSQRCVAIIGATESAAYLHAEIVKHDELGFNFKGFYDDRSPERLFEQLEQQGVANMKSILGFERVSS